VQLGCGNVHITAAVLECITVMCQLSLMLFDSLSAGMYYCYVTLSARMYGTVRVLECVTVMGQSECWNVLLLWDRMSARMYYCYGTV